MKTWMYEAGVVLILLVFSTNPSGGFLETIATSAVLAGFLHNQVADRLREKEEIAIKTGLSVPVNCYEFETIYFISKELLWCLYFVLIAMETGSWAGLSGVFIFLAYRFWRKLYRRYKPVVKK